MDVLIYCYSAYVIYIYIMFVCGLCQHFFHSYVFINNHLITHALTNFLLKTKKWSIRFLFVTRATESVKTKSVYYCTNILYYLFFFLILFIENTFESRWQKWYKVFCLMMTAFVSFFRAIYFDDFLFELLKLFILHVRM